MNNHIIMGFMFSSISTEILQRDENKLTFTASLYVWVFLFSLMQIFIASDLRLVASFNFFFFFFFFFSYLASFNTEMKYYVN